MEFRTEIVMTMPEKLRRSFDNLIRAWNKAHSATKDFSPVSLLKKGDRRIVKFDGDALRVMKSEERTRKGLALFSRAYSLTEKPPEKPVKKTTTSRTSKKTESKPANE